MALATNDFLRLALLALGAVPLLVTLLARNKTLVVLVPTVPPCFHPSDLSTLASVVFVSSIAVQLRSRSSYRSSVTPGCHFPACSIVGYNHSLVPSLLVYDVERASGSCSTRLNFISLSTLRRNSSGSIPAVITSTSTLPCFSVCCGPQGFTTSVSPLSGRFFSQGTLLHKHPAVYR